MSGRSRFIIVFAVATMLAVVVAGTALAGGGKGGGGHHRGSSTTGSFSLLLVSDANANGLPNYGDSVTFNVSSTASQPWVQLTCYQNGDWVINQYVGFYAGYPWSQVFPLHSWKWTGGAADCDARLFDGSNGATLAAMSFHTDA